MTPARPALLHRHGRRMARGRRIVIPPIAVPMALGAFAGVRSRPAESYDRGPA